MTSTPDLRQYPPTRLAFHVSRIIIDIGVLLVLGAMSLPFVSAEGFGQRAVAADALPALLLVLPIFVITLLPDQTRPVPTLLGWLSLLLAATALPYSVVKYLDAATLAATLDGTVGMGARILVVGAFVTLAGIVLGLIRNLLHLPVAGTYPARPAAPTGQEPRRGGTAAPYPKAPVSSLPAAAPPAPPIGPPRRPAAPPRPPPAPPPPPRETDPDTEPTLPEVRRPWWPDDLEDLFS